MRNTGVDSPHCNDRKAVFSLRVTARTHVCQVLRRSLFLTYALDYNTLILPLASLETLNY
jgi:hypothetical protein